jgi:hypothetical protein
MFYRRVTTECFHLCSIPLTAAAAAEVAKKYRAWLHIKKFNQFYDKRETAVISMFYVTIDKL